MEEMADDVVELLDALQITEQVVLGGLSMGGYVALSLMARYPRRVRGLMLMDTRAAADSPEAARNREELARRVDSEGHAGAVADAMVPRLFSEFTRTNRPGLIGPMREVMEKTPARAVAGALRGMARRLDRTAELPQIDVPTLVLVGADDVITPSDESRRMAEAIPNAQLVVVPHAGHLAPLENPAVANAAILGFLEGLA
jgi:pimeloyl-ACP methyl ester carboxylesterase